MELKGNKFWVQKEFFNLRYVKIKLTVVVAQWARFQIRGRPKRVQSLTVQNPKAHPTAEIGSRTQMAGREFSRGLFIISGYVSVRTLSLSSLSSPTHSPLASDLLHYTLILHNYTYIFLYVYTHIYKYVNYSSEYNILIDTTTSSSLSQKAKALLVSRSSWNLLLL